MPSVKAANVHHVPPEGIIAPVVVQKSPTHVCSPVTPSQYLPIGHGVEHTTSVVSFVNVVEEGVKPALQTVQTPNGSLLIPVHSYLFKFRH